MLEPQHGTDGFEELGDELGPVVRQDVKGRSIRINPVVRKRLCNRRCRFMVFIGTTMVIFENRSVMS